MANNIYWATPDASLEVNVQELSDPFGTEVQHGKVGVWLGECLLEAEPEDLRVLAGLLCDFADQADAEPERWVKQ